MNPINTVQPNRPMHPGMKEINIFDYIAVIMRRWKIIVAAFCVVFIVVAFNTFRMKPVYEASSTLHLLEKQNNLGATSPTYWVDPTVTMNTELTLMKSRSTAEKVVERLHLNWNISNKPKGLSFKILEFSSTSKKPVYNIKFTDADKFEVRDTTGQLVGQGQVGNLMNENGVTLLINDIRGRIGDNFQLSLLPLEEVASQIQGGFNVTEFGKQTNIIKASYTSTDPVYARDMVNAFVQAYMNQSIDLKTEETQKTVAFIANQIKAMHGDLESSEKSLESYKSNTGVVKLDNEADTLIGTISEMERKRTDLNLQKKQLEFSSASMKNAMKKGVIYTPGIIGNESFSSAISPLSAKLSELQAQKSELLTRYTPEHRAVKSVQNQIDAVQNKMLATLETSHDNLAKHEQAVAGKMNIYEKKMKKLPGVEKNLAKLTRVSKVNSDIYTFLLQKHEEARIAKESAISNINIVDTATTPQWPIQPNIPKNLLLGLLGGLALGIALAFILEHLDDTIKDADQAKRAIGLSLLGIIPQIDAGESRQNNLPEPETIPQLTQGEPRETVNLPVRNMLIAQREPKSVVTEAFRSLRTSLHFSAINKDKKIMVFTSTFPREGKSVVSSNTAVVIAQTGARVLVIDCDLRRSSLHDRFGFSKTPGLSEVLTRDVTFEEAKHKTTMPGLDVICAGTNPPNPSELLGSEAMRQLLLSQRENYDYIIIDAPPVLAVTDAPVLTTVSDIVILVMEAGRVPIKAAQQMREILSRLNAPVAGLVINDKTGKGERYSYYGGRYYSKAYGYRYGYGYGYGYGHGYYSDEEPKPQRKLRGWANFIKQIPDKLRKKIKKNY